MFIRGRDGRERGIPGGHDLRGEEGREGGGGGLAGAERWPLRGGMRDGRGGRFGVRGFNKSL